MVTWNYLEFSNDKLAFNIFTFSSSYFTNTLSVSFSCETNEWDLCKEDIFTSLNLNVYILGLTKADLELELDELEEAAELTLQEEKEEEEKEEEKHSEQNLADIMQKKLVLNPVDSDDSSDSDDSTDSDDSSDSESDTENTNKS